MKVVLSNSAGALETIEGTRHEVTVRLIAEILPILSDGDVLKVYDDGEEEE